MLNKRGGKVQVKGRNLTKGVQFPPPFQSKIKFNIMTKKITEFQAERLLHLASKLVDHVYMKEEENYWNVTGKHEEINIDDNNDWINEDELNESTHIFRCVYNLNKLIELVMQNI